MIDVRNLFDFIKRTWLLFFILFIAPIIVITIFAVREYVIHSIDLTAGEWANSMGCVFTYWGTILLGALAFWQNDRIMRLEERNAEIQETELKIKSTPDFIIDKIYLHYGNSDEIELDLEELHKSNYKETYQSEIEFNEKLSHLSLYILLKNSSNSSAYNVESYELVVDKKAKKKLFTMGSSVYKLIDKTDSILLNYCIDFDSIHSKNGVKFAKYCFNLNYENIYHHHFYNHMSIFAGISENKIVIQVAIGEQHNEKKSLEPKSIIS